MGSCVLAPRSLPGGVFFDHHRAGRCLDPGGCRLGHGVCVRHGDRRSDTGPLHRRWAAGRRSSFELGCGPAISPDVQGDHQPSGFVTGGPLFHPAGDRMDPVPATVGAEDLGGGVRGVGSGRCQPDAAQHGRALLVSGRRAAHREHGVDEAGCQQGRSWPTGRRRSMTSSTRRSAASAKVPA